MRNSIFIFLFAAQVLHAEQIERGMSRAALEAIIGKVDQVSTAGIFQYLYFENPKMCEGDGRCIVTLNDKGQTLYCENFYPKYLGNCEVPKPPAPDSTPDDQITWKKVIRALGGHRKVECTTQVNGNTIHSRCDN